MISAEVVEVSMAGVPLEQRRIMQAWCCETLGYDPTAMSDLPLIYFNTMEDATFFIMKWSR
jgi:hypothetical protein